MRLKAGPVTKGRSEVFFLEGLPRKAKKNLVKFIVMERISRQKWYKSITWQKIRKRQLKKQGYCELCYASYRKTTLATVCDHIDPHWTTFREFCKGPFQSLCRVCHDQKTKFYDMPSHLKKKKVDLKQVIK